MQPQQTAVSLCRPFVLSRSSVYWGVAEYAYLVLVRRLAHARLIGLGALCTARAATAGWTHESLGLPSCNWAGIWGLGCLGCLGIGKSVAQPATNADSTMRLHGFTEVIYLQDYLQSFKNTCLIVSHDRGFLNTVCTDIILLNGRKLTYYKAASEHFGTWSRTLTSQTGRTLRSTFERLNVFKSAR